MGRIAVLAFAILLAFLGTSKAEISNSSAYRAFYLLDAAGSGANSTNYNVILSMDNTQGIASSVSYKSCIGYVCVEFGPLGEIVRVTFLLQLNVSGPGGDVAYVDTNTLPGIYQPGEISRFFGCIEDPSVQGAPAYGLAFAGSRLNYIRLGNTGEYFLRLQQEQPLNRFVLPVTVNGCQVVRNKMPLGLPLTPFVPFNELLNAIELIIGYPIDLVGNYERTGTFTLVLEKTGQTEIRGEIP